MIWTFYPETQRKKRAHDPIVSSRRRASNDWRAPEHVRMASDMERDFPRDDFGRVVRGASKELIVDKRPRILIPPRPTYSPFYEPNHKK